MLASALLGVGCARKKPDASLAPDTRVHRSTKIELEACPVDEGERADLDANLDGRPEIQRKMRGSSEQCRVADLNGDDKPDRTTFFDDKGLVRRVESDFDRDGRVDEISLFVNGAPTEKHRATSLNGKLDTWEFYENGKLVRTERDKNGDGIIDQWWEYPKPGCPLIHTDGDGDGRPDPQTTIDYCQATGYVPPEEVKAQHDPERRTFESSAPPLTEIREVSNEPGEGASGGGAPQASGAKPSASGGAPGASSSPAASGGRSGASP